MKQAILVNGVPASGKSTIARLISNHFAWPLLSLDAIKEPFFEHIGVGDREHNRGLGRASYAAIFNLIKEFPEGSTTVVDAWFGFQPIEVLEAHLRRADIGAALEIWCHAPPDKIASRYSARADTRVEGHPGLEYLPELLELAACAKPLGAFPRFDIDTDMPIDPASLTNWIEGQVASEWHMSSP